MMFFQNESSNEVHQLFQAIQQDKWDDFIRLLTNNPGLLQCSLQSIRAIDYAASLGRIDFVTSILRFGVDPCLANPATNERPSQYAYSNGHIILAGLLLRLEMQHKVVPFFDAIITDQSHRVRDMLKTNKNLLAMYLQNERPIDAAAKHGSLECMQVLVEYQCNPLTSNIKTGITPLQYAERAGHQHIVAYLKGEFTKDTTAELLKASSEITTQLLKVPSDITDLPAYIDDYYDGMVANDRQRQSRTL